MFGRYRRLCGVPMAPVTCPVVCCSESGRGRGMAVKGGFCAVWVWVGSGFSFSGFSVVSGFLGFWLYYTPAGRTTTCHSTAHTLVTDAYVRKTLESGASWQPTPAGGCAFGRPLQRGAHSSTHITCMLSAWVGATEPGNFCIFLCTSPDYMAVHPCG